MGLFICGEPAQLVAHFTRLARLMPGFLITLLLYLYEKVGWPRSQEVGRPASLKEHSKNSKKKWRKPTSSPAYLAGSPHINMLLSQQLLAQLVEMLVTVNNSPIQDHNHQDKCNRRQLVLKSRNLLLFIQKLGMQFGLLLFFSNNFFSLSTVNYMDKSVKDMENSRFLQIDFFTIIIYLSKDMWLVIFTLYKDKTRKLDKWKKKKKTVQSNGTTTVKGTTCYCDIIKYQCWILIF